MKVQRGTKVQRGEQLGVMGYTGEGLGRERAHVHLELNLLLSRQFDAWYELYNETEPNYHGLYNGINLMGIDVARLFLALRKQPSLTIPEFLASEETFYKVTLPGGRALDLVRRYPWLLRGANRMSAQAWEVSFNRAGVPLKVEARDTSVTAPTLSFVKQRGSDYALLTRGMLAGAGSSAPE